MLTFWIKKIKKTAPKGIKNARKDKAQSRNLRLFLNKKSIIKNGKTQGKKSNFDKRQSERKNAEKERYKEVLPPDFRAFSPVSDAVQSTNLKRKIKWNTANTSAQTIA